jgi:hypothetical protein
MTKDDTTQAVEPGAIVPDTPEKIAFIRALIARGEASRPGADGKLPPGATHEVLADTPAGVPIVVRRRFASLPWMRAKG